MTGLNENGMTMRLKELLIYLEALIFYLIPIVVGLLFLLPGLEKRTDVCLQDSSVSKDGSAIIIKTSLSASMGFIRDMETEKTDKEIHCSFYRTFGGLNSAIGAENTFEIKLDASTEKIYCDRGEESDALVLEREAATNIWTISTR